MVDKKKPGPPNESHSPAAPDRVERKRKLDGTMKDQRVPQAAPPPTGADDRDASMKSHPTDVQDHIGRQLRALYDEVASQPVPDRFMELLNRLDTRRGEE
jgi:hypothetical protein